MSVSPEDYERAVGSPSVEWLRDKNQELIDTIQDVLPDLEHEYKMLRADAGNILPSAIRDSYWGRAESMRRAIVALHQAAGFDLPDYLSD